MVEPTGSLDERNDVTEIRRKIERAENTGDVDASGAHPAADVAMLPASGPRHMGIEAVVELRRTHFETYDMAVEFTIDEIEIVDGLAVERGTDPATLDPTDGSDPETVAAHISTRMHATRMDIGRSSD